MDEMKQIAEQALTEARSSYERRAGESGARVKAIAGLFVRWGDASAEKVELYVEDTYRIPLDKLQAAVVVLTRSHHWPRLPLAADIWRAARHVAGMHREQYHAGRYLPAPREWPPEGQRHGIQVKQLEDMGNVARLGEGLRPALGEGDDDRR